MQYVITPASRDIVPYATWRGGFTGQELDDLQSVAQNANQSAKVGNGQAGEVNPNVRRADINWVNNSQEFHWLFDRLGSISAELNADYFGFNLTGFGEALQFTNYLDANQGTYGWHQDFGGKNISRKLSLVLQLTCPSEYEGGNLEILTRGEPITMPKERGLVVVFPSWTLHQVTPVTRGHRQTVVAWVSGPNFI